MSVEPYTLDAEFERALVAYLVIDRKVYGALRPGLEADAFPTKAAQVVVEMCALVFQDMGTGPGSSVVVAQKLRHRHAEDGKLTFDAMISAMEYMEDAIDADRPSADAVVASFAPQIQERLRGDVLRDALMGLDPKEMRRRLEVAETVGYVDTSLGSKLGVSSFSDIASLGHMEKLPTGIPKLDTFLEGGAPRGQLWAWLGDSNSGKSTALGQQAAATLREGGLVLFGTNELPPPMVKAKILGDLCNIPFKAILQGRTERAAEVYAKLAPQLGDLYVKELDTGLTTPGDLDDWRKEVEDQEGRKVDLMAIDYADRMTDGLESNSSDYVVMRNVYNGLVNMAKAEHMVVATASQAKARKAGQKFLKLGDMADSRHKGRIANVVVSLNWDDEEKEMWLYICKQKLGASDVELGPIPTDWEYGRVSTIPKRVQDGARPSDDWQAVQVEKAMSPFATQ